LTDQLRIYIHPTSVVVVHERRGLKRQLRSTVVRHLEAENENNGWMDAIALLQSIIAQDQYRGLPAKVVLSSHFLKYRIVPWHDQLSQDERARLVQHQFEEVYGDKAAGWHIALSNTGFKKHELACAFEAGLISALKMALKQRQIRLLGIQPVMVAALNRFRKQIQLPTWLVLVEEGMTTLAGLSAHGWESVRTQAFQQDKLGEIALLLERESLLVGSKMTGAAVFYYGAEQNMAHSVILGQQVKKLACTDLPGLSSQVHPEASLAWVA